MPQIFKIGSSPEKRLRLIIRIIEANSEEIIEKWQTYFGETRFYC